MFNHPIFDTAISIVLIYALLSVVVSILIEIWNHYRKSRGKLLIEAVYQMLHDPLNKSYGALLLDHFLIKNLQKRDSRRPPQYISSNLFAEALIDIIAQQARHVAVTLSQPDDYGEREGALLEADKSASNIHAKEVMQRFKTGLESMNASPLRDMLFSLWDKSDGKYSNLKAIMEQWYNDYMQRVTGWYKNRVAQKSLVFGFLVAIGLNVDSVHLLRVLSMDEDLSSRLTEMAGNAAENYAALADSSRQEVFVLQQMLLQDIPDSIKLDTAILQQQLRLQDSLAGVYLSKADSVLALAIGLNIPLGWSKTSAPLSWLSKEKKAPKAELSVQKTGMMAYVQRRNAQFSGWYVLGILISGFALSTGAPFWFDVLIKLVNIRRSGAKPNASA